MAEEKTGPVIGIDLGTSSSFQPYLDELIAYIDLQHFLA